MRPPETHGDAHVLIDRWTGSIAQMQSEWMERGVPAPTSPVSSWDACYGTMVAQEEELKNAGQWVSGPSDLLHVLGIAGLELRHSRIVARLLTPTARHGLGARLLAAILQDGWPDEPVGDLGGAIVEEEITVGHRRADVVVRAGPTTLIIENKIWAPESSGQSEDLYQLWSGTSDVRFLFLTLDGRAPRQTKSLAAARAWRRLSYPSLATWLEAEVQAGRRTAALAAVEQYVTALRRLVPGREEFSVKVGG